MAVVTGVRDSAISRTLATLKERPARWLVTGSAGFIGSHLVEALLQAGQTVVSLDNFATGRRENLDHVASLVGPEAWSRHRFVEGDIRDPETCQSVCTSIDYVLHQAALGSVPRSIARPVDSHATNVNGFLNILVASRDNGVKRLVYASSSAVYGDHPALPKVEPEIGRPLSPYAVTKRVNELYADVFASTYGMKSVGLRYFNVFGPRQDPDGPYAAVIPRWVKALLTGDPVVIYGDGETSRDFCYVKNVVQANILGACRDEQDTPHEVFNVAVFQRTSLQTLFECIRDLLARDFPEVATAQCRHDAFRPGDVRHSLADITRIGDRLGYVPSHDLRQGLVDALEWYVNSIGTPVAGIRAVSG